MRLTKISRKLKVPVSTLYEDIKHIKNFFRFTIVLKDDEIDAIGPNFSFYYELVEGKDRPGTVPLQEFTQAKH